MRGTAVVLLATLLALGAAPASGVAGAAAGAENDLVVSPELFAGLQYRSIGPSRGGRVTAVAGHPARPSTFFMGASGGGVWRTTDYGSSWFPVADDVLQTGSIGAIAVADSNPDIVYVATGSDGLRSNVIVGKGVYKSEDGGDSWRHVGLQDVGNTGAVIIHPSNPDVVYVAAIGNPFAPNPERGVYRSRDGGGSWERVLFVSERTGAVDLEFVPGSPAQIYATMWETERKPWTILSGGREGGVYKSEDGGDSWAELTSGLPQGLRGKADLAVSAGDPQRVYVLIEAPEQEGGVYRSDDRGATWTQVTDFQPIRNRPFYYTNLNAHPTDPDVLWGMAEGFYRSDDGGATWSSQRVPHGDNHDLWVNPDDPDIMIQSNDGGANVTRDGGATWSTQNNQPTAELYQVDISDDFPYRLYAGQQDNSTISVPSLRPRSTPGGHTALWESHGGCETGPVVPKPGDPDIVYADCKGRFGLYNRRTGQEQHYYVGFWNLYGRNPKDLAYRFQRVAPIHVSPHNASRVYHTSQYVHVTENNGQSWETISPDLTAFEPETQVVSGSPITLDVTGEEHFSVIYEIQESPHEAGVIWVGANDGPIQLTRDGGDTWTDVTPDGLGPFGRVQTIEVSPHDPARAYLSVLRYQLGDFEPYAYRTDNYGATWTRLTTGDNGIPADTPVRVVREDPARAGLLYAGTEFGMFISFDDGATWQPFQLNLPVTPITDIKLVQGDLVLSTMGRGFWILYDVTPLHEMGPELASRDAHLFAVRDPYRVHGGFGFGRGQRTPDQPDYPTPGASIDYWLSGEPAQITLEIADADGNVVRTFTGGGEGERTVPAEPGMRDFRTLQVGTPSLPTGRGLHRFTWDLRLPGPWDANPRSSGRGGPMVPPGRYEARLSVGDWSSSVTFEARLDPRVEAEGITADEIRAQAAQALAVRDTLSRARRLAAEVEERLGAAREGGDPALVERLGAARALLVNSPVRYTPPMLLDQLQYLYGNLGRADQAPSAEAEARHKELMAELAAIEASLQ